MAIDSVDLTRQLRFDALGNVRDLGGYCARDGRSVRWNCVYRADDLATASRRDLAALADLGVRTIIDLRTDREVAAGTLPNLPGCYVDYHHLPLLVDTWAARGVRRSAGPDPDSVLAQRYLAMLVEGAPAIADAIRLMASPSALPLVFHSTLGRDRAGVLAAVLLGLLGVPDEAIAQDYALSARADGASVATPATAMVQVLAQVQNQGRSMISYVRGIGVPSTVIESVQANLLV